MKMNIKKLSEITGFSPATVSNALNNKRGVNKETAEHIWEIARKYQYVTEDKVKRIRLVTYRDSGAVFVDSPFFSALMEGIENESHKSGYEITIFNLYRQKADYEMRINELLGDTSAAILLIGTELNEADAAIFKKATVPFVLLDCSFDNVSFNTVLMNNQDSACQAVNYLVRAGHKKIGYLKGNVRIRNFLGRERGYELGMRMNGLPIEKKYQFEVPPSIAGAYEEMDKLLSAGPELPTAFFADNDMVALGCMQALQKHNYSIPADISIIGFDDISFCEVFAPGLTTIRVHKKELGKMAVRRLIDIIENRPKTEVCMQLCNDLVERASVAAPR